MESIEDYNRRIVLICKPEQSGKTFEMIQQIVKNITHPHDNKKPINIILCDNNLLLTKQTTERIATDTNLSKIEINGETYIELSSHRRTKCHTSSEARDAIVCKGYKSIICCTNSVRIDDIYEIISFLNDSEYTAGKFFFNIWLDEADKYVSYINSTFKILVKEYNNVKLNLLTATSDKLFKEYENLNVFPLENTTTPNYHGWNDNEIQLVENIGSCESFIDHILDNIASKCIKPDTKWFIPAEFKKKSHNIVAEICKKYGFAVIIVNGDGIRLKLPDQRLYEYKKNDELNSIICRLYKEHNLNKYPIAITGNICIGRGISIMSNDFMLDYGILSLCHNKQEASQNAGRLKGNIKDWSNYKKPVVFTTEKFNKIAVEWEKKSRELAKLAFKKQQDGVSTIISENEFKTITKNYEYIIHNENFDSYNKAFKFLESKYREMGRKPKQQKKSVIHNRKGYSVTSKLLKAGQTVDDLTEDNRITIEEANKISASRCISTTNKGSRFLILPVYQTKESPPESVKYQVRYVKFKKQTAL